MNTFSMKALEKRLAVRIPAADVEAGLMLQLDTTARILGCSVSHLIRSSAKYALANPELLRQIVS